MTKKIVRNAILLSCILTSGLCAVPSAFAGETSSDEQTTTNRVLPNAPTVGPAVTSLSTPAASPAPGKGVFSATINYSYSDKDTWYNNGSTHSTKARTISNVAAVKFRYGLGNNWDVRTVTPFIWNNAKDASGTRQGAGDSSVVFRNLFMQQKDGAPLNLSAGFGFVIPTGDTGNDGLGAGAFGLHGEIGATYSFDNDRQVIEGGLIYIWVGEGGGQNRHGDQADNFRAHARYAYALDDRWSLGLETVYNYYQETEINGTNQDNAKHIWFGGPAVTYKIPAWKVVLGASVQASLYQDINPDGGLGEQCCFEFKFMKVF